MNDYDAAIVLLMWVCVDEMQLRCGYYSMRSLAESLSLCVTACRAARAVIS